MEINNDFERQKAYLHSLCNLNIVRSNYESSAIAQEELHKKNILVDFHRKKLKDHENLAQKILRIFGGSEQTPSALTENVERLQPNFEEPVFRSAIYAPNTFMPDQPEGSKEVANIQNKNFKIDNELEFIIENMSFQKDLIYSENAVGG